MKAIVQARKPAAFTREENLQLLIKNGAEWGPSGAEWAPSRSKCFGEEKSLLPLPETKPRFMGLQPVALSLYHWSMLATIFARLLCPRIIIIVFSTIVLC
jgi:hypothetical protein